MLDKIAQDEKNKDVACEVGMINAALALLGNANYKNNLVRRFVIKKEINAKYAHLRSDKVPMTGKNRDFAGCWESAIRCCW